MAIACPMDGLMRTLNGSWTTYILWILSTKGETRFGALKREAPGISPKVLTERLRHLEASGLIWRAYVPSVPPRVSYGLTERGRDLGAILAALNETAQRWAGEDRAQAAE